MRHGILALALFLPAILMGKEKKSPKPASQGGASIPELQPADYLFRPIKPSYHTAKLVLRNPKKLRPLFVVGKGVEGKLGFQPLDMTHLGGIAKDVGLDALGGLVELAKATGEYTVGFESYSGAPLDLERTTCGEWLKQDGRPKLRFRVLAMEGWRVKEVCKAQGLVTYTVKFKAEFCAGERKMGVEQPVEVKLFDPVSADSGPSRMTTRFEFVIRGADFGLSGDDAGEIQAQVFLAGYVDVAKESKQLLQKKIVEIPSEMEMP